MIGYAIILSPSIQIGQVIADGMMDMSLLGASCLAALIVTLAIIAIILAALKDDHSDRSFHRK